MCVCVCVCVCVCDSLTRHFGIKFSPRHFLIGIYKYVSIAIVQAVS